MPFIALTPRTERRLMQKTTWQLLKKVCHFMVHSPMVGASILLPVSISILMLSAKANIVRHESSLRTFFPSLIKLLDTLTMDAFFLLRLGCDNL